MAKIFQIVKKVFNVVSNGNVTKDAITVDTIENVNVKDTHSAIISVSDKLNDCITSVEAVIVGNTKDDVLIDDTFSGDIDLSVEDKLNELLHDVGVNIGVVDNIKMPLDNTTIEGTLTAYCDSVNINDNWSNPNNALDNTTNTSATLSATASGITGTTSNTTNGIIIYDFKDSQISQLDIVDASVQIELSSVNSGVPVGGSYDVDFEYSLDGVNFTTFDTITDERTKALTMQSIPITTHDHINDFKIRATGTVISGVGLNVVRTVNLFRCSLIVNLSKTYG